MTLVAVIIPVTVCAVVVRSEEMISLPRCLECRELRTWALVRILGVVTMLLTPPVPLFLVGGCTDETGVVLAAGIVAIRVDLASV